MHLLPAYASCERGGGGDEPVCYFKIVKIVVSVKARDLVPPMTKAQRISDIPIGSKLATKKQGSALKAPMGGEQNSLKIPAPLHLIKIYQMRPL
jgi:hypothetical protein